jgi:signal transduction histidine kinase
MREMIYLSERKLNQFLPNGKPKRYRFRRELQVGFQTPLGSVNVGRIPPFADDTLPERLQRVVEHLAPNSRWFQSTEVVTGQWISFYARMKYTVFGNTPSTAMAVFIDEDRAQTRLLLHGSPQHLLIGPAATPNRQDQWWNASDGSPVFDGMPELVPMLFELGETSADLRREGLRRDSLNQELQALVRLLDHELRAPAEWMAGYARVTAQDPAVDRARRWTVVATPLFVERVPPPDESG